MSRRALLYGATGYTGRLIAEHLAAKGIDLVLAGRDTERLRGLAQHLGLDWRAFDLSSAPVIEAALDDIDVVLHAAGPFKDTAAPMMRACLASGAHYLDLAGEWPVFVHAMTLDEAARKARVMMMPGVGLTIAVTDCLLALALRRQPDAVKLRLGVSWPEVITRGTMVTAANYIGPDVLTRRHGRLESIPAGTLTHAFDFGAGLREASAVSWADVVTGQHTTGVGDIEVYSELNWAQRLSYRTSSVAMAITGAGPWRAAGGTLAAMWPEGPSAETRSRAGFVMVAEAIDPWRRVTRVRMRTLDGYTASVITAGAAVERVLAGGASPGFQTPARVFGADFIFDLGCASLDAAPRLMAGEAV
jgi:short subunit dehydrogenase-like uncharacterized protein